ncbi:PREDICTED: uncharacterized protein LOC101305707 [Fragaria vesca subsp. vesca]
MVRPSAHPTNHTLKFLYSYGGKILPRHPDGKLRYHGGTTRVLAVPRSISFPKLLLKLEELCGATVVLRCQLPTDDLDTLISIKNDEDLANIVEEYDTAATPLKIRAILSLLPAKKPPSSSTSSSKSSSSNHSGGTTCASGSSMPFPKERCPCPRPVSHTVAFQRAPAAVCKAHLHCAKYHAHANPSRLCHVNNNNTPCPYAWK